MATLDPARFDHNADATRTHAAELFRALRPVFRSEQWNGFWGVTRHETLREVGRDPATFAQWKKITTQLTRRLSELSEVLEQEASGHDPFIDATLKIGNEPRQIISGEHDRPAEMLDREEVHVVRIGDVRMAADAIDRAPERRLSASPRRSEQLAEGLKGVVAPRIPCGFPKEQH